MLTHQPCNDCSFGLFIPIIDLKVSTLGLYSDARFPGRCILSLNEHYDDLSDLPSVLLIDFMEDVRIAIRSISNSTDCSRVNFAVLGNRESHVHAHLIPRYPGKEEFPDCSPWNDKRNKSALKKDEEDNLVSTIAVYFKSLNFPDR